MADQVLLDIKIPTKEVVAALNEISRLRERIEGLRETNKNLDKTSAAYAANAVEIKALNKDVSTNERLLIANEKARQANKGSVEQLREQLKIVSVQWAKEASAMGENSEEAKKLGAQKTELTARLKKMEAQTGDTRRNVGNYSEGMREALKSSTAFNSGFANLSKTMAANPILLVVLVLDKLIAGVSKAQFIVDAFNKVLEPLNAIFERTVGIVQELISGGLSNLVKILSDPISAIKSFGAELGKAADQGKRLAEITIEIENAQNDLIITEGKLKREFEEQKFLVEDLTLSNEERTKAAENAIKSVQELEAARLKVLDKEIEQAQIRASLNDTDRAAQKELNELLAQRDNLAAESVAKQKEVRNQLNNVQKQIAAEEKAANDARIKANEDRLKKIEELEKKRLEDAKKELEQGIKNLETEAKKEINILKEKLLSGQITREEYEQELTQVQEAGIMARQVLLKDDAAAQVALEEELLNIRLASFDAQQKALEKQTEEVRKQKEQQVKFEQMASDQALSIAATGIGQVAALFGEQTVAFKLLNSAQALITTYSNATKAYASQLAIPTPDAPIRAQVAAGVAVAQGLAQVAAINSVKVQKFKDGVIGLNGPGTGTSDSIPAQLSRGESVVTAKASNVFAPVLAQMELAVGNRPNFQLGNRRFAAGIINAGNQASLQQARAEAQRELRVISEGDNRPIIVSVEEFERVQTTYNNAKKTALITE